MMGTLRPLRFVATTVAVFATVLLGVLPADASPGWNAETLDSGNSTGAHNSTVYYPVYEQHHVFNQGMESGQSVLRHGWFQPGYHTWVFETLDKAISNGTDTATVYYPVYEQHHVFNQGMESGQSVLRHGWFQPGYHTWAFETLDAGISTGTDTATVIYGDQHHLFTHGVEGNQDVLRHGWFDPAVGIWQFETLDSGVSRGLWVSAMVWADQLHFFNAGPSPVPPGTVPWASQVGVLRHGWYSSSQGWQFETLWPPQGRNAVMVGGTAALADSGGYQRVFFASTEIDSGGCESIPCDWQFSGRYEGERWSFETPSYTCNRGGLCGASARGRYPSATVSVDGHTEVYDLGCGTSGVNHLWWDPNPLHGQFNWHNSGCIDNPLDGGLSTGLYNAATTYPVFNQHHNFNRGVGGVLRHIWWQS